MALGPFTARRRLTCPWVLTRCRLRHRAHPTTSAPFRVRAYARIRPVIWDDRRGAGHNVPVSWCLSAAGIGLLVVLCPLGTWAFLAVGLPVLVTGPDPNGVATFRTHEMRSGWVPSLPRGQRCPHGRPLVFGRRLPHRNGKVPGPQSCSHRLGLEITRHHRGFTCVHPSDLPRACDPRMERESLGLLPELHTSPLLATHVGVGTGIVDTCLGYVTIDWSSDLHNHSLRATSCRTKGFSASSLVAQIFQSGTVQVKVDTLRGPLGPEAARASLLAPAHPQGRRGHPHPRSSHHWYWT